MSRYRPEFVMARVDTIEACGGDANLAVIHGYIEFRLRDYAADRKRATRSREYRADDDGRVWLRCTSGELGVSLGQASRSMPSRVERLVDLGLLDRVAEGKKRWYATVSSDEVLRADHAQPGVETGDSLRADHAQPEATCAQIARNLRADHAQPEALSSLPKKEEEEPKEEEHASASLDAGPVTDVDVHVGAISERRSEIPTDARGIVNLAWEYRKAGRGSTPALKGGYIALVANVQTLLTSGNEPRLIALAIYHNDGAWTLAAMQEQMRQIRTRVNGPPSRGDLPSEVLARVAARKRVSA